MLHGQWQIDTYQAVPCLKKNMWWNFGFQPPASNESSKSSQWALLVGYRHLHCQHWRHHHQWHQYHLQVPGPGHLQFSVEVARLCLPLDVKNKRLSLSIDYWLISKSKLKTQKSQKIFFVNIQGQVDSLQPQPQVAFSSQVSSVLVQAWALGHVSKQGCLLTGFNAQLQLSKEAESKEINLICFQNFSNLNITTTITITSVGWWCTPNRKRKEAVKCRYRRDESCLSLKDAVYWLPGMPSSFLRCPVEKQ